MVETNTVYRLVVRVSASRMVTKATLIEEEHTRVWPFGNKRKIMGSRTTNKMVIEYKITNKDEIERQKVEKQRHTETLRQFVTMKGE